MNQRGFLGNVGMEERFGVGHAIAEALESGHLHHLQELDLAETSLGEEGAAAIARVLQGGACPQLVKLDLSGCGLSPSDAGALGEAMRLGACVNLEHLGLERCGGIRHEGFVAIFGALEAGRCPSVKHLELRDALLSVRSATTLGHALRSGNCHHLQELDMTSGFDDRRASLHVLQAIQQGGGGGGMPNLTYLSIANTHMDQEHGRVLGEAIGGGALSKLEELEVSINWSLGDGSVVPIMTGLAGGGGHRLKSLNINCVDMGPQGGQALARALASDSFRWLESLSVEKNEDVCDHTMADIIKGLTKCRRMQSFDLSALGLGEKSGEALIQTLGEGCWLHLEKIDVSDNPYLGDGVLGVGLAEVLKGGGPSSHDFGRFGFTAVV